MMQEISCSGAIFLKKIIFSEYLEKENVVFRASGKFTNTAMYTETKWFHFTMFI